MSSSEFSPEKNDRDRTYFLYITPWEKAVNTQSSESKVMLKVRRFHHPPQPLCCPALMALNPIRFCFFVFIFALVASGEDGKEGWSSNERSLLLQFILINVYCCLFLIHVSTVENVGTKGKKVHNLTVLQQALLTAAYHPSLFLCGSSFALTQSSVTCTSLWPIFCFCFFTWQEQVRGHEA